MRLKGRVCVITGAGSGIGRATALRFAEEGATVVVAEVNPETGGRTALDIQNAGGAAQFIPTDVTSSSDVAALTASVIASFGRIDVLVNNAGASYTEDLLEISEDRWDQDLNVNLKSFYRCCKAVVPAMIERGGGSIVNISSVNALRAVGEVGYSAAKAGVISLTQNVAVRYGEHGIRCNAICPGTIESETVGNYWDQKAGGREKLYDWYPLHRLGQPIEVANAALFLACDESSFVTGSVLTVDGGLTAGWKYFGRRIV